MEMLGWGRELLSFTFKSDIVEIGFHSWNSPTPNWQNCHQECSKSRLDWYCISPTQLINFHLALDASWLHAFRQCSDRRYLVPMTQNMSVITKWLVCLTRLKMTSCRTTRMHPNHRSHQSQHKSYNAETPRLAVLKLTTVIKLGSVQKQWNYFWTRDDPYGYGFGMIILNDVQAKGPFQSEWEIVPREHLYISCHC